MCILSNTNKVHKVKKVAETLGLEYFILHKNQENRALQSTKLLNLKPEEIAVVGDQVFTDVLGANRCNMFSILTKAISKKGNLAY